MPRIYTLNDFIRSVKQLIAKYHALDKKNKCMQSVLDASHKENESIQNDLDCSYKENERMQKSMNQMIPLANQLNGLNNKLGKYNSGTDICFFK
ncbi:hypothetical protein RhiirA4_489656 [Rhizophagus irregularis]|uniref:Uncharacterized protein n=1 Tax=Rhizophagus irregularis TaxID=588596 RepID=A0A2I1HV00_9GLOM|nr:hypothetical protein RhiirA4_489656 [Rhizophagus irregularis]